MDGGHYIPRGKTFSKLLEENIHPQCKGCNGFGMKHGTSAQQYTIYMQETYGEDFVKHLLENSTTVKKWNRIEVEELLQDIKEQIKHHEKRISCH